LILFLGILSLIAIVKYPYFGFYFLITLSTIPALVDRIAGAEVPTNSFIDGLTYFNFLTILLKYRFSRQIDSRFWTNPISICMYLLFAFYIVQLFNPEMFSAVGWFSFFRRQVSYLMFFYMTYVLLNTRERIVFFIRYMIGFSTILALYACKQQWFGYAGFELRAIGTGNAYTLLFQGGLLRKFSVFSDPATSGVLFSSIATLCIVLFIRSENKNEKRWLVPAIIVNFLGYSYSGTRTATAMILAGIVLYGITTLYEKRTFMFLGITSFAFAVLMVIPFQNVVTNRIKSTFEGTRDASASLRDYDRHEVQPYIQAHPLGGGIFTCGFEGPKYNKGHYLEFLQPDSGYLKVLAEQGATGLALLLFFYFVVMRRGLHYFFRVKDAEIQNYYIGLIVMMFTLMVSQYSQMAIAQTPLSTFFYATMVIFIKFADFDKQVEPLNNSIQN
jgi:putative inorganic carbon (hco3(-)) transporter